MLCLPDKNTAISRLIFSRPDDQPPAASLTPLLHPPVALLAPRTPLTPPTPAILLHKVNTETVMITPPAPGDMKKTAVPTAIPPPNHIHFPPAAPDQGKLGNPGKIEVEVECEMERALAVLTDCTNRAFTVQASALVSSDQCLPAPPAQCSVRPHPRPRPPTPPAPP